MQHLTHPVTLELTAIVVAMKDNAPHVLVVESNRGARYSLPSGPLQSIHRNLQSGLRHQVENRTGLKLGYIEQLYTFGDRVGPPSVPGDHQAGRRVSIAYIALVQTASDNLPEGVSWKSWYDFFPCEDWRDQAPNGFDALICDLQEQAVNGREIENLDITFGLDGAEWDGDKALERYEALYEAMLVPEAWRDQGRLPPADLPACAGQALGLDHRRMVATAISRLRGKIRYRPVLFELMPHSFTLYQLQANAEAVSGTRLHKQNFRRLVEKEGLVEETGAMAVDTGGRPAKLMRFRRDVTRERPAPGVRVSARRRPETVAKPA